MLFGLACGLIFILAICLTIGAVLLRASIGVTNWLLGAKKSQEIEEDLSEIEIPSDDSTRPHDSTNPYESPRSLALTTARRKIGGDAIPEPSFGRACVISLIYIVLPILVIIPFGLLGNAGGGNPIGVQIASQIVGFSVFVMTLIVMLPTSFGRATLIYFVQIAIVVGVGVLIFGGIFTVVLLTK